MKTKTSQILIANEHAHAMATRYPTSLGCHGEMNDSRRHHPGGEEALRVQSSATSVPMGYGLRVTTVHPFCFEIVKVGDR